MQYVPCGSCLFPLLWGPRLWTITQFTVFWGWMSIVGLRLTTTSRFYFETVNVKMVADLPANWRRKNQHVYCAENLKQGKIFWSLYSQHMVQNERIFLYLFFLLMIYENVGLSIWTNPRLSELNKQLFQPINHFKCNCFLFVVSVVSWNLYLNFVTVL